MLQEQVWWLFNVTNSLSSPAAPEDEHHDPAAPALRWECRIPAGHGSTPAPPVVCEVLRALGAARVHHLPEICQDEPSSPIFPAQNPAHHQHHHPQRWVQLDPCCSSFPTAEFSLKFKIRSRSTPNVPKMRLRSAPNMVCPKQGQGAPKIRSWGAKNVPKQRARGVQNVVVPKCSQNRVKGHPKQGQGGPKSLSCPKCVQNKVKGSPKCGDAQA